MEKQKRKFVYLLMIFGMLLPYLLNGMSSFSLNASAETTETQTLVDNDQLKVEAEGQVEQESQRWQVSFEKKTPSNEESQLKIRVNQASETTNDDFELIDDWYTEKDFSAEGAGVLEFVVPKEANDVQVEIQLNERNEAGEILENQLSAEEAGPYELKLAQASEQDSTTESSAAVAQTEESVVETPTETEAVTEEDATFSEPASTVISGFSALNENRAARATPADPFEYFDATNPTGIYPKHNTDEYLLPTVGNSDNIKNYNYGNTAKGDAEDNVTLFNISGDGLDFTNGYHEYGSAESGRLNTKKTVSPTADLNIFQVQLDTIGDAIRPIPKVDIVLVLDKSSSMVDNSNDGKTRWKQLQEAVTEFSNDMLSSQTTHDVQIGMASFGSEMSINPYGEIASFSDISLGSSASMPGSMAGFTQSASALQGHAMFTTAPGSENSGTPTFLGLDAGLKLLTTTGYGARADAKKVIITITDGEPTFRPTSFYDTDNNLDNSLGRLYKETKSSNRVLRMRAHNTMYYAGTGNSSTANITPTVNFINNRYNQFTGLYRYGVGFHTGNSANEVVSALGKEAAFKASDIDSLIYALNTAISELISTIYNALLTDPMSDYVTLDQSSIKYSALLLSQNTHTLTEIPSTATDFPDFAKGITSTVTAGQIQLDHLNLGLDKNNNRQGYRITYNVTLKEAYRDGKFYPTNQTTYLANGNSTNKYYAVPSVKVPMPKVDFNLTKIAAGTQTGLAGAKFQLFDAETGGTAKSDEVTSGTNGELKFTGITPGTYWLRETVTPEGFQTMNPIQITVDRQGKVTGEGITDGKISNTLKKIDLTLNKKGQDGNALAGAVFELKQGDTKYPLTEANGVHTLKNLSPGTYEVIETSAPAGYRLLGTIGTLTVTNIGGITFEPAAEGTGNNFTVDKKGENIQIKMDVNNQLKPFELGLTKRDAHDAELFLQGAVFTLYDKVPTDTTANELATLTTDANGKGQFKKTDGTVYLLEAGKEYYFKETTAPSGYLLSTSIFKVSVGTDGSVTVEKDDEKIDSTTTLEADKNNQIGLMVDNDPKAPLPETGGIGRLVWLLTGLILIGLTAVYLLKARFTKEVL